MTQEIYAELARDPRSVLSRGYRAKDRIAACEERIQRWRERVTSITVDPSKEFVAGGSDGRGSEDQLLHIVVLEEELRDEIVELAGLERETKALIYELIVNPNYRFLLELRYLNYLRWEEIAVRMHYTLDWTKKLHKRILRIISAEAEKKTL